MPGITTSLKYLEFILDTGAMVTIIPAMSALTALDIPQRWFAMPTGVVSRESLGGVGGSIGTSVVQATYRFRHEDGRTQDVTGVMRIADFAAPAIPSLLGWDVLEHFDIAVKAASGEVSLSAPKKAMRASKPRS